MDIGSLLLNLLAGGGAPPAGGVPGAVVPPPPVATPAAAAPPVATPAAPGAPGSPAAPATVSEPLAESYKSPPDLVSMYSELMSKAQRQDSLSRGMTLIAAGLAQDQNKGALIDMAGRIGGGGSGSSGMSMEQMINLRKLQLDEASAQKRAAQLPGLMTQYGLDLATVTYLDETGQLDETISALAKPETEVVEKADKSKILINKNTGETIKSLSPTAPRETEFVDAPDGSGGKVLVYKDDKTRVDSGEKITETARPKGAITTEKLSDGRIQAIQDGKPLGEPYGPEELSAMEQELAEINRSHRAAGEPEETLDDWIIRRNQSGTEAGTTADLNRKRYGNPPAGKFWIFNADGSIKMDADGVTPMSMWDKNSKEYQDYIAAENKTKAETEAAAEAERKAAASETTSTIKKNIHYQDVTTAIDMIDKNRDSWIGVGGWGGTLGWLPASDQKTFNGLLYNIGNRIGINELQAMRDANPNSSASGLGQVTEGEHRMLQQAWGNLDPLGDPRVLRFNLRRIQAGLDIVAKGVEDPPGSGKFRKPTEQDVANAMGEVKDEYANIVPPEIGGFKVEEIGAPPKESPNKAVPTGDSTITVPPNEFVPIINVPKVSNPSTSAIDQNLATYREALEARGLSKEAVDKAVADYRKALEAAFSKQDPNWQVPTGN